MDPPPDYKAATQGGQGGQQQQHQEGGQSAPKARNGIPLDRRRSMEDEARPLPEGWIRQYDPESHHQYFVDTRARPARSIWHHPYDDPQFMASLSEGERRRVQESSQHHRDQDLIAESSDEDGGDVGHRGHHGAGAGAGGTRPGQSSQAGPPPAGLKKFGRKLKDKMTNTTHEERKLQRQKRAEAEQRALRQHEAYRRALAKAAQTGQPQLLGRDNQGKEVYVQPPQSDYMGTNAQYDPYGGGGYGYGGYGAYGNPYGGMYGRPGYAYSRPYGGGYGGGYGMPLMGGMMGGMLMGSLLF